MIPKYYLHETFVRKEKGGDVLMFYERKIPTSFDSLIEYVKGKESKFLDVIDTNTISIKINKNKTILIHRTLLIDVMDISFVYNTKRFERFMTMTMNIVYRLICQYD